MDKEVQEFRFSVVETLLGLGIPLNRLDKGLNALLARTGMRVTHSAGMRQYIPKVLEKELSLLKEELEGETFCLIFDGTTRVGEALAVVVRYCTADFHVRQRLIALQTAEKHMSGGELCGMLIRILVNRISPGALDASAMFVARDSCSTNGAAVRSLKQCAMPYIHDILCFSHTLHNCAKHMKLEALEEWLSAWFQLMAHTHRAKELWRAVIGQSPVLYIQVRWWSRMECANQLATHFSYLSSFVDRLVSEHVGGNSTSTLQGILACAVKKAALRLDMAIMLDASIFCEKTYRLEGDRLELFCVVEEIEAIRQKGRTIGDTMGAMPNVAAVLRNETVLVVGTPIYDWFGAPYNRYYKGKVTKLPSAANPEYHVAFSDGTTVPLTVEETRNAVDVRALRRRIAIA